MPGVSFRELVDGVVSHGLVSDALGNEQGWIDERQKHHQNPGAPFEVRRRNGDCYLIYEQRLADGSTTCFVADITGRKDMEHALKESVRRHQVFMSDIAHQLRTLLAVLNANLETIEHSSEIESLKNDVESLSRLVEGLLAETKVEDLEIASDDRANLGLIARSVAAYLGPQAIKRNRLVEVTAPDEAVWVWGRTQALQQAIQLLVENAIEQTPDDTVVTIEVTDEPAIFISDHGPIISEDAKARIFMLGLRADQRGNSVRQGLSAVRRIADIHGAEVGVFDGNGDGNVFYMRFPN